MRWRRNWPERPPRPKVRSLTEEKQQILAKMTAEIARSPLLSAFAVQVRCLRGRFYVEKPTETDVEAWGRITPVEEGLLLEVERESGTWSEVAQGTPQKLIKTIAGDTEGDFHGLGALDRSLRQAGQGLARLSMKVQDERFVYADTGKKPSVGEILFHFFGVPVEVVAQPTEWYAYHRTPRILEFSKDAKRVLVRFSAVSGQGEEFGGTCLYAKRDGEWGAYTIRPNASESIAAAEAWLVKRKWEAWD